MGVKLDVGAVGSESTIDPTGELSSLFQDISDKIVQRQFDALHPGGLSPDDTKRLDTQKELRKAVVKNDIMPALEADLKAALASVVASNFIEQNFLQLRWDREDGEAISDIEDRTVMLLENLNDREVFGTTWPGTKTTWREFKAKLAEKDKRDGSKNGEFILSALQAVVRSAFSSEDVDNNQLFLNYSRKIYRVIVTRYNIFYDGTRIMNVYFIPFVDVRDETEADNATKFLKIIVEFRQNFLTEDAPFKPKRFRNSCFSPALFRSLVNKAMNALQIAVADSHNAGLDDPTNFLKIVGQDFGKATATDGIKAASADVTNRMEPRDIASLYSSGQEAIQKLMEVGNSFRDDTSISPELMENWSTALEGYLESVTNRNLDLGSRIIRRLEGWFSTGTFD